MRLRMPFVLAAAAFAVSIAACSSSSSSGTFITPTSQPLPTPAPVFHFQGKLTQVYTYDYGYPSPEPPATIVQTITQQFVTYAATPPPKFPSGVTDAVHVTETATSSLQTTNTTSDVYLSEGGNGTAELGSIAQLMAPDGGQSATTTQIFGSPQILKKYGGDWTNSPAATIDETYSDGHYQDRTIAANGTYTEIGTTFNLNGTVAKTEIAEQSSGAGTYTGPFFGLPHGTQFAVTAPSGSPPTIGFTLRVHGKSIPYSTIPAWFDADPTFFHERDSYKPNAALPAACGKHGGKTAGLTERLQARLDTMIGYQEAYDEAAFDDGSGPVCVIISDVIFNYYDWQGDTPQLVLTTPNGKPVSRIFTYETLTSSGVTSSANRAATVAAAIAGMRATVFAKLDVQRAKLRDAALRRLLTNNVRGGVR